MNGNRNDHSGCFGCLVLTLAILAIDAACFYGAYCLAEWFFTTFFM